MFTTSNTLYFGQESTTGLNVWAPIFEKTFAKLKGSYDTAAAGFVENGLRVLTGAPVESFKASDLTSTSLADAAWTKMKDGLAAGYILGIGTDGADNT